MHRVSAPHQAVIAAAASLATLASLTACSFSPTHGTATTPPAASSAAAGSAAAAGEASSEIPVERADLQQLIDDAIERHGGKAAVALARGDDVEVAGRDEVLPTWSTIKVPIAIAALRKSPELHDYAYNAITYSDNDSAEMLWETLGEPDEAASATERVYAEGSQHVDVHGKVDSEVFSPFGETPMTTKELAAFGAKLPEVEGSEPVLELMGEIDPEQSYGLGHIDGARFKGGWGPNEEEHYDVRQFGLIPLGDTPAGDDSLGDAPLGDAPLGVALSVNPESGSYDEGQEMASEIAEGLEKLLAESRLK